MNTIERIKAALDSDAPGGVEWRTQLESALFEIERLRTAHQNIHDKYAAIMRDPPDWVKMTPEQLKWVREAWYGASLISRKALNSNNQ